MGSALNICRNAAALAGIEEPDSIAGSRDVLARALGVLFNRSGQNLARRVNGWGASWTVLQREHVFNTVAGQEEYPLPGGYIELVSDTVWNRTTYREARGALSPQEWQRVRSGLVLSTGVTPRFRIKRGASAAVKVFAVDPVPAESGEVLVYEYRSSHWLASSSGASTYGEIQSDSDVPILDSDLIEMDVTWRVKQNRGLPFAAELGEFEVESDKRFGEDATGRTIYVGRRDLGLGDLYPNVPESGFGL